MTQILDPQERKRRAEQRRQADQPNGLTADERRAVDALVRRCEVSLDAHTCVGTVPVELSVLDAQNVIDHVVGLYNARGYKARHDHDDRVLHGSSVNRLLITYPA